MIKDMKISFQLFFFTVYRLITYSKITSFRQIYKWIKEDRKDIPRHFCPFIDNLKPSLHIHLKLFSVSIHLPFLQTPEINLHSFVPKWKLWDKCYLIFDIVFISELVGDRGVKYWNIGKDNWKILDNKNLFLDILASNVRILVITMTNVAKL